MVGAFVADAAVGAHDAGVVDEHVVGDGARVRILGVAVEIHLDDPVADCLGDLVRCRAAAAVEDEIECGSLAVAGGDRLLYLAQNRGA
jgi:hypothetical protein